MNRKLILIFLVSCIIPMLYSCNDSGKRENNLKDENSSSTETPAVKTEKKVDPALAQSITEGEEVYTQNCAVCHQKNGKGVPNMNPPLNKTDYVLGDKNRLISFVLKGSSTNPIEVDGATYSNVMPSFSSLDDAQLAHVLTYIRNSFGNEASGIDSEEVKSLREKTN